MKVRWEQKIKKGDLLVQSLWIKKVKLLQLGHNRVLKTNDPTAHAEIEAIRLASQALGTYDLSGCTLYTSCEPCPMCLSASIWANIQTIYYGCTRKDAANIGFRDDAIYEYLSGKNPQLLTLTPLDREACLEIFKTYEASEGTIY